MSGLIESWRQCQLVAPPFLYHEDKDLPTKQHFGSCIYRTYEDFVASSDYGQKSTKFHLGLIPQPYIGNLDKARVLLLLLNPGFSPNDYYAQENSDDFYQARVRNLRQENGNDEYPFFYLNPAFAWTAGGQWWLRKLDPVLRQLESDFKARGDKQPYQAALRHVSRQVACLELCPYFSQEYKQPKPQLASMEAALAYAREIIMAADRNALVVVMRQIKTWDLVGATTVISFNKNQARGAHLTVAAGEEDDKQVGNHIYEMLKQPLLT